VADQLTRTLICAHETGAETSNSARSHTAEIILNIIGDTSEN
jgi:hypothetical protein